jgi:protein-tyrosine sulfotransferase
MKAKPPIFVLGVPRSGTTLLRTMLDSHPSIACGPETPWLCGHQPRSVMELCRLMTDEAQGYCASFGMPRDVVMDAAREFVSRVMGEYAHSRGKKRWAEKTPDNALHVDFLLELFPEARFIHIVRDGLDVVASTCRTEERAGISDWHKRKLVLTPRAITTNTPLAAMLRWRHWNRLVERFLAGREHLRVSYERLVTETEPTLRQIAEFCGERYDSAMLDYGRATHDMPAWEWGSADVRARPTVTKESLGRAQRVLSEAELEILRPLAAGQTVAAGPAAAAASVDELTQERFRVLIRWFNQFAQPLGLRTHVRCAGMWQLPWLWLRALGGLKHDGLRVIDVGSGLSPLPWLLAMLGATVKLVERDDANFEHYAEVRDKLRVHVEWSAWDGKALPCADGWADAAVGLSALEHAGEKPAERASAMAELARVLRPGGVLALGFDLCEPKMEMTMPEGRRGALTLGQFEKQVWMHPGFGNTESPEWNRTDLRQFLAWHRKSGEDRNYVVGAAVMIRSRG